MSLHLSKLNNLGVLEVWPLEDMRDLRNLMIRTSSKNGFFAWTSLQIHAERWKLDILVTLTHSFTKDYERIFLRFVPPPTALKIWVIHHFKWNRKSKKVPMCIKWGSHSLIWCSVFDILFNAISQTKTLGYLHPPLHPFILLSKFEWIVILRWIKNPKIVLFSHSREAFFIKIWTNSIYTLSPKCGVQNSYIQVTNGWKWLKMKLIDLKIDDNPFKCKEKIIKFKVIKILINWRRIKSSTCINIII